MSLFSDRVLSIVKLIPEGRVASYGQIAALAGVPRAAIAVGEILHKHGDQPNVPWWRVINHAGHISTKCMEHNANMQKELLSKEGIPVSRLLAIDMSIYRWIPTLEELQMAELPEGYIEKLINDFQL